MFDLSSDSISFSRGLDKQEGRVLSLAWHPDSHYMAVGGADSTIRKLDIKTGRCILRITLDEYKSRSTLVWDLKFLSNSTIVSADSLGKVQFWNSLQGTLIHSHTIHSADVLSLAVNKEEDEVYSAGVDQKIVCLKKASDKSKWLKCENVRAHSHDIRALALSNTRLIASGGVDTQLITCPTSNLDIKAINRHHPIPDSSRFFTVANSANVLVHQSSMSLRFWQLSIQHRLKSTASATESLPTSNGGRGDQSPQTSLSSIGDVNVQESDPAPLPHCTNGVPKNFLEIRCKEPQHILSSTMSADATNVALSTVDRLWLYNINHRNLNIVCVQETQSPCYKMGFTPDGQYLVLATIDSGVKVVDTSNFDTENARTIQVKAKPHQPFTNFEVSSDSKLVALSSNTKRIVICNLESGDVMCKVPRLDPGPTLFTFTRSCDRLVLFIGAEKQLCSFNIANKHLQEVGYVALDRKYEGRFKLSSPNGLVQVPNREDVFAVYDNDCVVLVRGGGGSQTKETIKESSSKGKRKERSFEGPPLRLRFVTSNRGAVLFAGPFGGRELVLVERSWTDTLSKLPPALARSQYGT